MLRVSEIFGIIVCFPNSYVKFGNDVLGDVCLYYIVSVMHLYIYIYLLGDVCLDYYVWKIDYEIW